MTTVAFAADRGRLSNTALLRSAAYIDGRWIEAGSAGVIEVDDPFTGEIVGCVPCLDPSHVDASIEAAERAFRPWSRLPFKARGDLLRRWLELIERDKEDLARLITLENGKPLKEARAEVAYGAAFVEFYAEQAGRVSGEIIPSPTPGRRLMVEREPVGVCAAITPWNFPMAMLTRKAAPALAAGCTIIAKPASQTPLTALALAVLAEEAGVPPGVLNVLTGAPAMIGERLTRSSVVRKISFTGSTGVGASLMAASAATIKRLSLELGGNAPLLIFDDADLDTAIETAMVAKFRNSGQSCIAANRIYVQQGLHDTFVEAFAQKVRGLKLGDGFDEGVDIGPLIDAAAVKKVGEHLQDALSGDAELLAGGGAPTGRLFPPTLLRGVRRDSLIAREETFGPLAGIIAFESFEDGLAMANDTPFGLAAYVCSDNSSTIARASRDLESGMVGINTGLISTAVAPFGGVKLSGLGREGSSHGIDEYLNLKYLCHAGV